MSNRLTDEQVAGEIVRAWEAGSPSPEPPVMWNPHARLKTIIAAAISAARREERADVIAWLRTDPLEDRACLVLADRIEAGEIASAIRSPDERDGR